MMPIGITDIVTAGRIMWRKCAQSGTHSPDPPGPAPVGGSHISCVEKMMTSTMPSQ
ncbi:hypothetical protein D3C71_1418040 [compost metagenome]